MSTALHFNYSEVEPKVRQALYAGLGQNIAIDTAEVEGGHVFVKVVAPILSGLTARQSKRRYGKPFITLGPNAQVVTLALAFGMDEI